MKIALIPARGGSKRIPRKNIKIFSGKPMIAHSILAAQNSKLFDRIIVSTDDTEIANIAQEWGAEVPFIRPAELSGDYTGTMDVIQHGIKQLELNNSTIDYVCCIYATAPFITPHSLQNAFQLLLASEADYVFTVTSFPFPVQRALFLNKDSRIDCLYPEFKFTRSQDLVETYHDAGQFYFGKTSAFKAGTPLFSPASCPLILPRKIVQDIDTPEDWQRAEMLYQLWQAELNDNSNISG
ncbi:pseudaminic acid cytidylyltransferase [Tolumonas lignilytica]|jgi:pseudaminic acid CMP-transferase|uniref:pseudaminic acid cytidylyltransferase n=1 Tax=Tolumonas lignilytica TaxID=1283284 RepID=UPI0004679918|nr:pseudaminic acid cytidylyltransferase [Tolumonas lignilytica]